MVDLSALEVEIKVTESLARDLRPGMTADLEGGGHHWQGVVSGVSPEVVAGQVTARLRFGAEKPAGLRQSQRLSVRIFLDRRDNVLMVDRGSFVDQEGGGFAYVVHGNIARANAGADWAPPASPKSKFWTGSRSATKSSSPAPMLSTARSASS